MNATLAGHLFGGDTLAVSPVSVTNDAEQLTVAEESQSLCYALQDVQVSDRIGRIPRYLYLPDGRTVETLDNDTVDSWLAARPRGRGANLIHWLEQRSRIAAAATLLLVVSVSALAFFGLPVLAKRAAFLVPASIERKAGDAAMQSLRRMLKPSTLSKANRARVDAQLARLVRARALDPKPQLEFGSIGEKNPNAFALPGGYIVMTDELVDLAKEDDELAAVLAHEIGHHVHRHGLQDVFRNSAALLLVSSVTGDLSTLTTFSSTIPFLLLQRGYSREFETEADQYAIETLLKAEIDPHALAEILEALEKAHTGGRQDFSYLSTHPATADRIRVIDARRTSSPAAYAAKRMKSAPVVTLPIAAPANSAKLQDISDGEPVDLVPGDTPPKAVTLYNPVYPDRLRRDNIEGSVVVEYIVDRQGKVHNASVISSTHQDLENPAIEAVAKWKFTPGRKGNRIVATRIRQTIMFNLQDSETDNETPVELGPDDTPARLLTPTKAVYPPSMVSSGMVGEVEMEFIVDREGNVRQPKVLNSNHHDFEVPALASLIDWKFDPAIRQGEKVPTRQRVTVRFNLKGAVGENPPTDAPTQPSKLSPPEFPREPPPIVVPSKP